MPKKFKGENSKATVAKARKAEKAAEEKSKKDQEADDLFWKDDDKHIAKKLQRKEEKDRKKQEVLERKSANKMLAEQELEEITPKIIAPKVTVFQIEKDNEERKKELEKMEKEEQKLSSNDEPIVENLNRVEADIVSGSGIDGALVALSMADGESDSRPEMRMATAFKSFEEENMPRLKKENPKLRLSQLKQLLRKEWQKSPLNPIFKKHL